jgi:hypothetical protein
VLEIGGGNDAVGEQHLAARHTRFRFTPEVEHDLEELGGIRAFMQRTRQVGGQSAGEQLDLLVPVGRP